MDIHAWLSDQYSLSPSTASLPAAIRADSPLLGFPSPDNPSPDPLLHPAPDYARDKPVPDDSDRDIAIKRLVIDMNFVFHDSEKPLPDTPQSTPLPSSASPTRRSSRFPSIASAVTLGIGSDHRKAVYIPDPAQPSSSPVSTSTVLTTPALSPFATPAMSPTATSFSTCHDDTAALSRRPSFAILSPSDTGLSRKPSYPPPSLSRNSSLASSNSPIQKPSLPRKPSSPRLSRKPSIHLIPSSPSRKNSTSRLSHLCSPTLSPVSSQVFLGSDGGPDKAADETITHVKPISPFTPPSPSISAFSRTSHSSVSASPRIHFEPAHTSSSSPHLPLDYTHNLPPPSPPLTPATIAQLQLYPHSDPNLRHSDVSRSRWSLTSSLLEPVSPPSHTPHFSFPFSAAAKESGKAHSKTKSAPSASGDAKDRAPQGKAKMGRKRARLVSFISRLGGAQAHATASGTDTPTSPSVPSSTSTVNGEPGAPRSPASSIGPGLVPLAVDLESGPTSPVSASGSVPGSPVSFIAYGWGGGSVPSSPSVPAFPRFDDSGVSVLKEKEGKMGKVRARASTLNVGGGTGGMGFAAIVGMGVARGTRRRLVVRGIGAEDVRAYEAVRAWCESFGEVRHITRKPNGELHVDFRKSSVADTVCRVQAQVYIKGAGSVCLSWYTKK